MGWVFPMTSKQSWLRTIPFHPFFFAAYPILALLAFNVSETYLSAGLRPLILSLLVAGILYLILHKIYQDWMRAALVSSIVLIAFYSYGHIYNLLTGIDAVGALFQPYILIPLWLVATALLIGWVSRKPRQLSTATYILNVMGLTLLLLSIFQLASYLVRVKISDARFEKNITALDLQVGNLPPDIYYIILDGYGRSDVLKKYGYDNSDFLNALKGLGFFVADCAQSNYAQTKMSIASSLNFNYLDALSDRFVSGSDDRTGMDVFIHHSAVRKSLEKAGYKTIAFATGFPMTELTDADYYLTPQRSWKELNEFESLLLKTTLAGSMQVGSSLDMPNSDPQVFRERSLFVLDKLEDLPSIQGPKFIFVHLLLPHPPYVFGPTGGPAVPTPPGLTSTEQIASHYRDQATYISSRIIDLVPKIIANSATPPIIVIQGDHGPTIPSSSRTRMKNLNVYFLSGGNASLYSTITPVNTFRVIFNTYFGQNLPLLDDVSLYSKYRFPFDYKIIPNTCNAND
jgi:hypothetical protein